jgi:signal transduction histidine kinase
MLATIHFSLFIGSWSTEQRRIYLISTIMTLAASVAIVAELLKALSHDIDTYVRAMALMLIAVFVLLTALLFFVRWYLSHGWNLLFLVALIVWCGAHAYQLAYYPDSFFAEVRGLNTFETSWGESYVKLSATATAGKYLADLGSLLIFVYIVSASIYGWRSGRQRQSLVVGGASAVFLLVAGILVPLDDIGLVQNTMPLGLPFLGIVAALTYQMVDDRAHARELRIEVEQLRRTSLAGEIAAGLMHELNQPLTSILSNSQAARRFLDSGDPDLDEVRAALDDVVDEDKRAAGIIGGLRGMLRREQVDVGAVEINDTIRGVVRMLAGEFNTTGTRLILSLYPGEIEIEASKVQVEQVLINLIQNALRAMQKIPSDHRVLRISSTIRHGFGEIGVADSGQGVPPQIAGVVFEPFKSGGDGLGMGLAICKRIVTNHGGRIWIEDSEINGAHFVFSIPLARGEEKATRSR